MKSPIITAYQLSPQETNQPLNSHNTKPTFKPNTTTWIHLDLKNQNAIKWIENEVTGIDSSTVEAITDDEIRPRVTELGDAAIIILHGPNLNPGQETEDMVSVRLWIDQTRILSLQRRQLKSIEDIEKKIKAGKGPKNSGQFITLLIAKLCERTEPLITELEEMINDVEETILETSNMALRADVVNIRKKAIILKRYLTPQKDAVGHLRMADLDWLDANHKRVLQEEYNRIQRFIEDLDAIRERAQIVKDELSNHLADKLNSKMYFLSIVTSIFLPLGFLTGLLGVNVGGIPGSQNNYAFFIFCGILSAIVILQIIIFNKFKWF